MIGEIGKIGKIGKFGKIGKIVLRSWEDNRSQWYLVISGFELLET